MTVNSEAPIKDVQQFLKRKIGVYIPYTNDHKAKEAVCAETINAQREQYNLVEGYVQCLLREDPEDIVKLKTQQVSSGNGIEKEFIVYSSLRVQRDTLFSTFADLWLFMGPFQNPLCPYPSFGCVNGCLG